MKITKRDPFTGEINTVDIPISAGQYEAWAAGTSIQNAAPQLSADHREFIISGIPPGKWGEYVGEEE